MGLPAYISYGVTQSSGGEVTPPETLPPITDHTLFLDASKNSTMTPSSGDISTWADRSISSNNSTQLTGTAQPLLVSGVQNSKDILRWNGSSDFMIIDPSLLPLGTSGRTIFMVLKTSTTISIPFSYGIGSLSGRRWQILISNTRLSVAVSGADRGSNTLPSNSSMKQVAVYIGDNQNTNGLALSVNGVAIAASYLAGSATTINTGAGGAQIGRDYRSGSSYLNGDIAEILVYPRLLNATERSNTYSYLSTKWGL